MARLARLPLLDQQTILIDDVFSLTAGEDGARERFSRLTTDTRAFLSANGVRRISSFRPWPESGLNFLGGRNDESGIYPGADAPIPPELIERWKDWNREYYEIQARNPRLELRDKMQDISESHTASSWPTHYEHLILAWVEAGDPSAPPPFDDRSRLVTPAFFERLVELRKQIGGWLFWSDEKGRVVFVDEEQARLIGAERIEANAKMRAAFAEQRANLDRITQQMARIVALARHDKDFWEQLKRWELAREAKRPPKPPKGTAASKPSTRVAEPERGRRRSLAWSCPRMTSGSWMRFPSIRFSRTLRVEPSISRPASLCATSF